METWIQLEIIDIAMVQLRGGSGDISLLAFHSSKLLYLRASSLELENNPQTVEKLDELGKPSVALNSLSLHMLSDRDVGNAKGLMATSHLLDISCPLDAPHVNELRDSARKINVLSLQFSPSVKNIFAPRRATSSELASGFLGCFVDNLRKVFVREPAILITFEVRENSVLWVFGRHNGLCCLAIIFRFQLCPHQCQLKVGLNKAI